MGDLILIDLSSIFWAAWHATVDQEVSAAYEVTLTTVRRLAHGHEYCAVCCDYPPYWRKQLSAAYKAQRDAPAPQAVEQFRRVKDRLRADAFLLWSAEGFEADDVIATAVKHARSEGLSVMIASGDKDLLQLVDDGPPAIQQMKPSNGGEVFNEAAVRQKFGVPPWQMRDWLALVGDSSDNVPGVPGVGAKTAANLLLKHEDIDGLLRGLDTMAASKVRQSLMDNVAQLELSRKLVTLREDVPIKWTELNEERAPERITEDDMGDIDEVGDLDESEEAPPAEIMERPPETPQQKEAPSQTALAVQTQNGNGTGVQVFEQGLQPGTLGAAYKLAKGLHESRLYSRFPNPEAIWAIIIRGRELGLGALTALDNFHIVENKPVASAHLLIARAKAHPDCEYLQFIDGDSTHAEAETKNRKALKPTRLKYTIEQAKRAGLLRSGSNWEKRPEEMLRKTVMVQLARLEYPSATAGLYCAEEMD